MKWDNIDCDFKEVEELKRKFSISSNLAHLLIQRVGADEISVDHFLNPRLKHLSNPFKLDGLKLAAERIIFALKNKQCIVLVGDYDVDGITSLSLFSRFLDRFDVKFKAIVPDRHKEGYGLTEKVLERALSEGHCDLLITLDCGTNSVKEIEQLKSAGTDVIVVDHHRLQAEVPKGAILLNPHVKPEEHDSYALELCGVGLVFKLLHGLIKLMRENGDKIAFEIDLKSWLDLVALGTVADMVPLRNENRIFVHYGLKQLSNTQNVGLKALLDVCGFGPGDTIRSQDVSFKLAPRINASGRLGSGDIPFKLLTQDDLVECRNLAVRLDSINYKRQKVEKNIFNAAELQLKQDLDKNIRLLYDKNWNVGVVGIVAGKLSKKYHKPILVLGQKGEYAKGSGRSISGVDLVPLFKSAEDYLSKWGGHALAIGVTLPVGNVSIVEDFINRKLSTLFPNGLPEKVLHIANKLHLEDLNEELLDDLDHLEPFGQGNPRPIFCVNNINLGCAKKFGKDNSHLQWNLKDDCRMLGWGMSDNEKVPLLEGNSSDLAVKINRNCWNGKSSVQLELVDLRKA